MDLRTQSQCFPNEDSDDHSNHVHRKAGDLESSFRKDRVAAPLLESKEHVEDGAVEVFRRRDIVPGCRRKREEVTAGKDVDPELRTPSTDNSQSRPVLKNTGVVT